MPSFLSPNLIKSQNKNTLVRLQDVDNYKDIDILFLGSSRAYSTFDVRKYRELGYNVFNLGTSSQSPIQSKILLQRHLKRLNPKLVIYEVSPLTFASDGIESATDIVANGALDLHSLELSLRFKNAKVINSLIYRTNSAIFNTHPIAAMDIDESRRKYIEGGYVEVDISQFKLLRSVDENSTDMMTDMQVEAFEEIMELLKENQSKCVLVQVPFVKQKYELHNNAQFNRFISSFGEYYNFNDFEELTSTEYFRDDRHLNLTGVELFNDYLIRELGLMQE